MLARDPAARATGGPSVADVRARMQAAPPDLGWNEIDQGMADENGFTEDQYKQTYAYKVTHDPAQPPGTIPMWDSTPRAVKDAVQSDPLTQSETDDMHSRHLTELGYKGPGSDFTDMHTALARTAIWRTNHLDPSYQPPPVQSSPIGDAAADVAGKVIGHVLNAIGGGAPWFSGA
jgi:hypothetical protein